MEQLLADLRDEGDSVDHMVAVLDGDAWRTSTPAPGWTIAHQIGHLAWTDEMASLSAAAATGDEAARTQFDAHLRDLAGFGLSAVDDVLTGIEAEPPHALLTRWRTGRAHLIEVLDRVPSTQKVGWFGPPMSAASMATARIMESWAHGQDIADALGVERAPTHRLRHIAHLGVRTREFSFVSLGLEPPTEPVRVQITAPDGSEWTWGDEDAAERVTGSARDFALLLTQRAHRDDLDVRAHGPGAQRWLEVARAFAGPPGDGRPPRARTSGARA